MCVGPEVDMVSEWALTSQNDQLILLVLDSVLVLSPKVCWCSCSFSTLDHLDLELVQTSELMQSVFSGLSEQWTANQ